MLRFGVDVLRDPERALSLEWIETNGLGGWASAAVSFANTRRYHGMLVAAIGADRRVIVSKLDETVNGVALATNRFPGVIHPRGFETLREFNRGIFPEWTFEAGGVALRKTVVAPRGENTTVILYQASTACQLTLRPFLAGRDYHSLMPCATDPQLPFVNIDVPGASFRFAPDCWRDFEYDRERERGLDFREDLFTPGEYTVTLQAGEVLPVVLCADDDDERDALDLVDGERARRERINVAPAYVAPASAGVLPLAADQFLVRRLGEPTVIAGYHWFTDWGRDTMISLPGLTLATGRFADAKAILRRWLATSSGGMIPNRFPDGMSEPAFNAVDATLWMFVAVWRYLQSTGDAAFVRDEALPLLRDTIAAFDRGTRYNIHTDVDGLLYAGAEVVALTWMDAIVDGRPVTPRIGKPVEVNALWVNALRIVAELGDDDALRTRAAAARTAFEAAFWNAAAGCCYDVVDPRDESLRPNQVIALALPFPLFEDSRAESILRVVEDELLTPVGLRTLNRADPRYRGRLAGPQHERDLAYHNGTVWPWLLGPYVDAVVRVRGPAAATGLVDGILAHLSEAGIGTISEIFDGDAPHTPRGCIAQAWSVAEVIRVLARTAAEGGGATAAIEQS
jgi:predicted glycogen debranching enzyme